MIGDYKWRGLYSSSSCEDVWVRCGVCKSTDCRTRWIEDGGGAGYFVEPHGRMGNKSYREDTMVAWKCLTCGAEGEYK